MSDEMSKAVLHMYRSNFVDFLDLAFGILHPGAEYLPHWSIDLIANEFGRCHRGENTRLIINLPPRSLKSTCVSVAFPAWVLGVEPQSNIVCIAGHGALATELHERTLTLMQDPKYGAVFPHVQVRSTANEIRVFHGGARRALTLTGRIAGRGADLIIIDDPESPRDVEDQRTREGIRRWYDQNIPQRINDKHKGAVILVTHRIAEDDLTAYLVAKKGWRQVSPPAIATEDERFTGFRDARIVRKKGEALHPARETKDELSETLNQIGGAAFMAQYQQDPYPPGASQGGGVYTVVPHLGATEQELKGAAWFLGRWPEEKFVLESVFGEFSRLRRGPPPPMTPAEWHRRFGAAPDGDQAPADQGPTGPSGSGDEPENVVRIGRRRRK